MFARLLHEKGFSDEDRLTYKSLVYSNAIENTEAILDAMLELHIQLQTPEAEVQYYLYWFWEKGVEIY